MKLSPSDQHLLSRLPNTEVPPDPPRATARTNHEAAAVLEILQIRLAALLLLEGRAWQSYLEHHANTTEPLDGIETGLLERRAGPGAFGGGLGRALVERYARVSPAWSTVPVAADAPERLVAEARALVRQVDAIVLLQAAKHATPPAPPVVLDEHRRRLALANAAEAVSSLHGRLVVLNRGLVWHLLRRHHPDLDARGIDRKDCFQEGLISLGTAVAKYRCDGGAKFSTYATYWILQGIRRYLDSRERLIRIPINRVKCWAQIREYRSTHPDATAEEVSQVIHQPLTLTRELLQVPEIVHMDAVSEGGEAYVTPSTDDSPGSERARARVEGLQAALAQMPPVERFILSADFDLDDLPAATEALIRAWADHSLVWFRHQMEAAARRLPEHRMTPSVVAG